MYFLIKYHNLIITVSYKIYNTEFWNYLRENAFSILATVYQKGDLDYKLNPMCLFLFH